MWVWALLPVTLAVFGTVGIWVVYGMAVSNNTVNITEEFPYISSVDCPTNTASLVLGFISSIGISVLGNFQQSVVKGAHLLGALLAFFLGLAYFWVQAWLTYRTQPSNDRKWMGPLRIILCSLCTVLVICMAVFHYIGYRSEAAFSEWAVVMCFFALFGIFAAEFRHIDFHKLTVQKEGLKTDNNNTIVCGLCRRFTKEGAKYTTGPVVAVVIRI